MTLQRTCDLVLMGPPGSGKGTQAKALVEQGWLHLSTGDLFRENIRRGTDLGRLAEGYMSRGDYVPDDVTVGMVRERLRAVESGRRIVFDGFPRTVHQAEALDRLLAEHSRGASEVVLIDVPREELVRRLRHRSDGRPDDAPGVVERRLEVYERQTRPVIEHYERAGRLRRIPGLGSVDDIRRRLFEAVEV